MFIKCVHCRIFFHGFPCQNSRESPPRVNRQHPYFNKLGVITGDVQNQWPSRMGISIYFHSSSMMLASESGKDMPGAQTASDSQASQVFSEIKMELYYTYTYMIIYVQYVYKYAAYRYTVWLCVWDDISCLVWWHISTLWSPRSLDQEVTACIRHGRCSSKDFRTRFAGRALDALET